MVSGGKLGSNSAPLGEPATTELLARRLLRQLYAESRRPSSNLNIHALVHCSRGPGPEIFSATICSPGYTFS